MCVHVYVSAYVYDLYTGWNVFWYLVYILYLIKFPFVEQQR